MDLLTHNAKRYDTMDEKNKVETIMKELIEIQNETKYFIRQHRGVLKYNDVNEMLKNILIEEGILINKTKSILTGFDKYGLGYLEKFNIPKMVFNTLDVEFNKTKKRHSEVMNTIAEISGPLFKMNCRG